MCTIYIIPESVILVLFGFQCQVRKTQIYEHGMTSYHQPSHQNFTKTRLAEKKSKTQNKPREY